jgi:two-component system, LuxR family, response regulator FixJ
MSQHAGPVLVVDDDDAVRNSLKFALELEGLSVRLYKGAAEILAEADLPRHGCLVIDDAMSGMDGTELVRQLRQRQIRYPAILITSRANHGLRGKSPCTGFQTVLEKPLQDGRLLDSIHLALATLPADLRETP